MTKCNAKWQIKSSFEVVLKTYFWNIDVATCGLEVRHEGKHKAVTRSNVNNEVAYISW